MEAFWGLIVILGIIAYVYYFNFTEQGREAVKTARLDKEKKKSERLERELRKKPGGKVNAPISQVGKTSEGQPGLACPKCGGTQFKARRTGKSRAGIVGTTIVTGGIGGLLAAGATKQRMVTCVTCGTVFKRG